MQTSLEFLIGLDVWIKEESMHGPLIVTKPLEGINGAWAAAYMKKQPRHLLITSFGFLHVVRGSLGEESRWKPLEKTIEAPVTHRHHQIP